MVWCKAYFDTLNRLGVTHDCDRQMDGQMNRLTDIRIGNAMPNVAVTCAIKLRFSVTENSDSTGRLTKKRSRYVHLWIVVERLEEVLVGHLDISHPVEQILRPGVGDGKLR